MAEGAGLRLNPWHSTVFSLLSLQTPFTSSLLYKQTPEGDSIGVNVLKIVTKCWLWCWNANQPESSRKAIEGLNVARRGVGEVRRRREESKQSSTRFWYRRDGEEGWARSPDHQFPVYLPPPSPPPFSLFASDPLTPSSLTLSPSLYFSPSQLLFQIFLGNLRNNTSERDQESDTQ